ncbi:hypothetical protein KP509_06G055900 [Ceratopteris richardii]|uniref:Uncharacterized protein n=1 Tax=Ceratopteris richardii TaxID=49495 RepID=A0A8T2UPD6_CERRI|nr:hypothetical protein KP509_06G055900 [Ceratopteris richardii]
MTEPMSDASLSSCRSLGDEEEEGDDEEVGGTGQADLEEDDEDEDDGDGEEEDGDGESIADMHESSPLIYDRSLGEKPERLLSFGEDVGRNSNKANEHPLHEEDADDDDMDSEEDFMEKDDFDSANELVMSANEAVPHMLEHHTVRESEIDHSTQDHPLASEDLPLDKEDNDVEADADGETKVEDNKGPDWLDFLKRPPEEDDGTPEEQAEFVRELERFFAERNMEFKHPKFYQENLNCLKLWRAVVRLGGHEAVTNGKLWRQVGDTFNPPKSCTTVSWSFRIFYKKALLEYERFKFGELYPGSDQGASQHDVRNEGQTDDAQPHSLQPSFMPNLGRARRDAASRAMQGWHSQRLFGNGDIGDPSIKEKTSSSSVKRAKQLKMGPMRKKKANGFERTSQPTRNKGIRSLIDGQMKDETLDEVEDPFYFPNQKKRTVKHDPGKQTWKRIGFNSSNVGDIWVTDEGPKADWVKINVHKTCDCFEVYALVPGLLRDEVRIQCEPGGQLVIVGEPEERNSPWGITSFRKVIKLPLPIDASQTSAVVTVHGQLFVRVPFSLTHS